MTSKVIEQGSTGKGAPFMKDQQGSHCLVSIVAVNGCMGLYVGFLPFQLMFYWSELAHGPT